MSEPRRDTRGIVDPAGLMTRVRFRRHAPHARLAGLVEHYWFIDWDLDEPYESRVVPHPCVNVVFQRYDPAGAFGEVSGVGRRLFAIKLEGTGRVCGAQFLPGAFRAFTREPVSALTDQRLPVGEVLPGADPASIVDAATPGARVAAFDAFLLGCVDEEPDPARDRAMTLAARVRRDRSLMRVEELAELDGSTPRTLQRLFAEYVGVSPKSVIMRYRVQEAVEAAGPDVDWARVAAELGYADQAHLVRDFRAMLGISPAAFVRTTEG
ncbi:AraC family transcriptional regulator [Actinorhabdospora filicis]|uniref:AraC family transcriptional regulator n=1 Tax=Actinorhabdospora filicis TaxID=1785913 RepID=A0A9W6SUY4_9ACTN|nr:helix-turn-helix domain-containing protein [Actinorhabdospora filicis]GLZ81221.1 AraC family transcriptional regulator [Actinorhabdospora filicis]